MEDLVIGIDSGLLGDSLTSFPALNELSKQKSFLLWVKNKQVRSLWTHDKIPLLDERPAVCQGFDILDGYRKFAFSGLHIVQAWFDILGLPVPQHWEKPKLNVQETHNAADIFDVIICPFSRSGGGGLKIISLYKWDNIIRTLISFGLRVAVAGCFSSGEDPRFWTSLEVVEFDTVPLPSLAGRFLLARCIVTIDTGPAHLAHFLGVRHVHIIAQHPNLAPKEWVENRNPNATIVFDTFPSVSQEKILSNIFSALSEFNRSEYLEKNTDLKNDSGFFSNRLAAWHHFQSCGKYEGRVHEASDYEVVPGWHDDIFAGADAIDTKKIFDSFISIGDNCEFGLAQRHFGAEPLDLLRWMTVPVDPLCELFLTNFVHFGEGDSITIEDHAGEYVIREKNYDLYGHSFVHVADVEYEKFLSEIRKRFRFLKRKMLDDLADGERILVYKNNNSMSKDDISKLYRSVTSVTACPLLVVEAAGGAHEVGTVSHSPDNPLFGFVERFAPYESAFDISPPSWLAVAWKALGIVRRERVKSSLQASVGVESSSGGRDAQQGRGTSVAAPHGESPKREFDLAVSFIDSPHGGIIQSNVETKQSTVLVEPGGYRCVVTLDGLHGVSEVVVLVESGAVDISQALSSFAVELGTSDTESQWLRFHGAEADSELAGVARLVFRSGIPALCRFIYVFWGEIAAGSVRSVDVHLEDEPLLAINGNLIL